MSVMQTTITAGAQYAASSSKAHGSTPVSKKSPILKLGKGDITESGKTENYLTNKNFQKLQAKVGKMHGLNHNSRGEKMGEKGDQKIAQFGENVLELEFFFRRYIPWLALIMPGTTDQTLFNAHLEEMVCGRFFVKGGLMTPADWKAVSGSGGKRGKSGSLSNNLWKSYMEMSLRIPEHFRQQMSNPSKFGTSWFSKACFFEGIERGRWKAECNDRRASILKCLGCVGIDVENQLLIFGPNPTVKTFVPDYLDRISSYSNGALTKGFYCII